MSVAGALERPAVEANVFDRWIYVCLAALFAVTAVAGFSRTSAAILTGAVPSPPLVVHIHAALMAAWLALLLTQTIPMATGRAVLHKTLGLASLVLAPAMVVGMIAISVWRYGARIDRGAALGLPPDVADSIGTDFLLMQARAIILFAAFVLYAMSVRKRDGETHKRMMILATLAPIPAAMDRMMPMPSSSITAYMDVACLYQLLWLTPALAYELLRRGRLHVAYWIGLGGLVSTWFVARSLMGSAWWYETAPAVMSLVS